MRQKPRIRTKKRTSRPIPKLTYKRFSLKRRPKVNNDTPDIIEDILKAVPRCYYIPSVKRVLTAPFSFGFHEYSRPVCWCKLLSWIKYWFFCRIEIQTGGRVENFTALKTTARKAMEEVHAAQMGLRSVGGL